MASQPDSSRSAQARLRIHVPAGLPASASLVANVLHGLRAACTGGRAADRICGALRLVIVNQERTSVRCIDNAEDLTDLALVPGTYHVTAERAGRTRRYTMKLAPGTQFDLHLRRDLGEI